MSELRQNLLTGQWVILAENRGARPQDVVVQQIIRDASDCPFCSGREDRTPHEVFAIRQSCSRRDGPGWQVRVVPNKYPALEGKQGAHEIVVEAPQHLASVTELSREQFADVLETYRTRLASLRRSAQYYGATLFKNGGPTAGATLAHVHSQLLAAASADALGNNRAEVFRQQAAQKNGCPVCRMLKEETGERTRVVAQSKSFTAFCPHASRFAYETWIVPHQHVRHFDETEEDELAELAEMFHALLVKLEAIVKLPAYNYIVHTAPFDTTASEHYHWHIEILPRIANLAGFEIGTGRFINTVSPDKAAETLRNAPLE
jgi:UDPglucose--hexose-1-phosphate uridylyltransferase